MSGDELADLTARANAAGFPTVSMWVDALVLEVGVLRYRVDQLEDARRVLGRVAAYLGEERYDAVLWALEDW